MRRTPAPAPPRRRDFEQNRARILRAALALAAECGPESLSVSEVAHRAGINRTTAYKHFRTRDALLGAVMESLAETVTDLLSAPMALDERIEQLARYFVVHPEIARLALHQLLAQNPFPRSAWKRYVSEIERLTSGTAGQPGVDAEILAHVLMAAALLWSLRVRQEFDDEEAIEQATARLAREVKRLLLHGALREEGAARPVASKRTNR